ncbi:MAG: BamA/TamA family outer membrane protein [Planctomycetes bacterium]|nr:BamA/TamA family outer membrane protein [Planctomycetota bacterium]MCB9916901.1 BamA/TamA family outer membrane protein [Planctomycetota bacterium]
MVRLASCAGVATSFSYAAAPQGIQAPPQDEQGRSVLEGLEDERILSVRITGLENLQPSVVLAELRTRAGSRLNARAVREDLAFLWSRFKLQCRVFVERSERTDANAGVKVRFEVIKEFFLFDRMTFSGMKKFKVDKTSGRADLLRRLGVDEIERMTELTGQSLARRLEDIYRQEGYPNVRVDLRPDLAKSTLEFVVDEGEYCAVTRIDFVGNESFPAGEAWFSSFGWNLLGSAEIKSAPSHSWFSTSPYSRKIVEEDLNRLRLFYRDQGFKDAVVELTRVHFNRDFTGVELGIRIIEGRRYRFGKVAVRVDGYPRGSQSRFKPDELLEEMKLREGQIYSKTAIDEDVLRLVRFYGRKGYPSSAEHRGLDTATSLEVATPIEVVNDADGVVDVVFQINEGTQKRLREISIVGNDGTRDAVIRRELSVFPGDVLDSVELAKSRDRLLGLQYFGDRATGDAGVDITLAPVPGEPDLLDLEVAVREGSTGQFLWGAGISSNNGPFANIQYRKSNFDWRRPPSGWSPIGWLGDIIENEAFHGGGQTFAIDVSPGTQLSQASISFYEPDVFGKHLDTIGFGIDGFTRLRAFESYDENKVGLALRLDKRIGRNVRVGMRYRDELIKIRDIVADAPRIIWLAEGKTGLRGIGANIAVTDLDRQLQPRSGYDVSFGATLAPEWLDSEARFYMLQANGAAFLPLHIDVRNRAHVLTIRNQLSYGEAIQGNEDLYLSERLFLGGDNSLRGFRFRGVGPTQFGRPTGGSAKANGSFEYGFPIPGASTKLQGSLDETEILRGALFVDWGMLGNGFHDPLFDQVRVSAGFGLKIQIPGFGQVPIALYFGVPILRQETDRTRVFSFTMATLY